MPPLLTVTHIAEARGRDRDAGFTVSVAGPLLCITAVGLQLQSAAPKARFIITETYMTASRVSQADCESLICESGRLLQHYAASAARNGRLLCGTTLSSLLDAHHKSPQLQVFTPPPAPPKNRKPPNKRAGGGGEVRPHTRRDSRYEHAIVRGHRGHRGP